MISFKSQSRKAKPGTCQWFPEARKAGRIGLNPAFLGVGKFYILIVVVVTKVCTFAKTH